MNRVCGFFLIAAAAVALGAPARLSGQDPARALLDRAIVAAGGVSNLQRHRVLGWHGTATINASGRIVRIEGDWRIEPPDRAHIATFEVEKGPTWTRSLSIDGDKGWTTREGNSLVLPEMFVRNERDQFYLYWLARLVPMLENEFRLTPVDPDEQGRTGFRVERDGRRDATLYFTSDARLARIVTTITDPTNGRNLSQELRFGGHISASGIVWPRRIQVVQKETIFFDLELSSLQVLDKLEIPPCKDC
jgi:hypothetical protein